MAVRSVEPSGRRLVFTEATIARPRQPHSPHRQRALFPLWRSVCNGKIAIVPQRPSFSASATV